MKVLIHRGLQIIPVDIVVHFWMGAPFLGVVVALIHGEGVTFVPVFV